MGSGSGGRGRFAPKNGVIDMVGVASSAILGRRGLPAAAAAAAVTIPPPPPPHPPVPLPPRFPLSPAVAAAAATTITITTLFVAFALLPIASEGHPCVPLCAE